MLNTTKTRPAPQSGFTLIEIMIALALGLVVIAALISLYIVTVRGSADAIRATRLNHDLDSALLLITNDIRRSGYWAGAIAGADSRNNPFTAATTNVQIHGNCIVYTYDANVNGVVNDDEYFGFRLNNGAIQMRMTGSATTERTTEAASCTSNSGWEALTINDASNEQLTITRLTFSFGAITSPNLPRTSRCLNVARPQTAITATNPNPIDSLCPTATGSFAASGDRVIETRQVNVVIEARVTGDSTVTKSISNSVKLRNDRVFTYP